MYAIQNRTFDTETGMMTAACVDALEAYGKTNCHLAITFRTKKYTDSLGMQLSVVRLHDHVHYAMSGIDMIYDNRKRLKSQ